MKIDSEDELFKKEYEEATEKLSLGWIDETDDLKECNIEIRPKTHDDFIDEILADIDKFGYRSQCFLYTNIIGEFLRYKAIETTSEKSLQNNSENVTTVTLFEMLYIMNSFKILNTQPTFKPFQCILTAAKCYLKISYTQLSKILNIPFKTLENYLYNPRRSQPSIELLIHLADVCKIDFELFATCIKNSK